MKQVKRTSKAPTHIVLHNLKYTRKTPSQLEQKGKLGLTLQQGKKIKRKKIDIENKEIVLREKRKIKRRENETKDF